MYALLYKVWILILYFNIQCICIFFVSNERWSYTNICIFRSPDHEPDFRHRAICIGLDMLKEVVGKDNLTVPVVIQTARAVLFQLHYYESVAKLDDKKEERHLFEQQLNLANNLIAEWLQKTSTFKPGKSLCDNLTVNYIIYLFINSGGEMFGLFDNWCLLSNARYKILN